MVKRKIRKRKFGTGRNDDYGLDIEDVVEGYQAPVYDPMETDDDEDQYDQQNPGQELEYDVDERTTEQKIKDIEKQGIEYENMIDELPMEVLDSAEELLSDENIQNLNNDFNNGLKVSDNIDLYKISLQKKINFSKFVYTKMYEKQVKEKEEKIKFLKNKANEIFTEKIQLEEESTKLTEKFWKDEAEGKIQKRKSMITRIQAQIKEIEEEIKEYEKAQKENDKYVEKLNDEIKKYGSNFKNSEILVDYEIKLKSFTSNETISNESSKRKSINFISERIDIIEKKLHSNLYHKNQSYTIRL